MDFGWASKLSLLSTTTASKTLPRKENASKKFRQRPLRLDGQGNEDGGKRLMTNRSEEVDLLMHGLNHPLRGSNA
jgi:hypothetical protein